MSSCVGISLLIGFLMFFIITLILWFAIIVPRDMRELTTMDKAPYAIACGASLFFTIAFLFSGVAMLVLPYAFEDKSDRYNGMNNREAVLLEEGDKGFVKGQISWKEELGLVKTDEKK